MQYRRISFYTNPFFSYSAGFALALALYGLGFSGLFPPLSTSVLGFLLATICISLVGAHFLTKIRYRRDSQKENWRRQFLIFSLISILFLAELQYSHVIPILAVLSDSEEGYYYRDFGIPFFHVVFIGAGSFYTTYWFEVFIKDRDYKYLIMSLAGLSTSIIILYRGAFLITLLSMFFIYNFHYSIGLKRMALIGALAAGVIWGFGYLGDQRIYASGVREENPILKIGDASPLYRNLGIPSEFFWGYIYVSSPIGNLQYNIDHAPADESLALTVALDILPDFVSKRILPEDAALHHFPLLLTDELTVCTMYGRPYFVSGWAGCILVYAYFLFFCSFVVINLKNSKYFIPTVSILCSLGFLSIFDNMLAFAGGITQILVALALSWFSRMKISPVVRERPTPISNC